MSDLPKVTLMAKLTKSYELDAAKASRLADDLLDMHAKEPDAYAAALTLLEVFDKSLTSLARVLTKLGFLDAVKQTGLVETGLSDGIHVEMSPRKAANKAKAP
jgi:hypothetical protein